MSVATTESRYLISLTDAAAMRSEIVGGKAAGLARLVQYGFDVPEGVVLNIRAFEDAFGLDPGSYTDASPPLPSSVEQALLKVARRFGDTLLAVRSSGIAEDLDGASFAGQYETVLGVHGLEELVAAVRKCWASAFSVRLDAYRHRIRTDVEPVAVLIQQQVEAIAAGVAFTADPVTGDRGVTVINAVSGLADKLMSGEFTPEEWRVSDEIQRSGPPEPALSPEQAGAVAKLANDIATREGAPQDVEWAIDGRGIWLLQARPITALPDPVDLVPVPLEVPDGHWERLATHFPDPVSPLMRSTFFPLANQGTRDAVAEFGILAEGLIHRDIGGWSYLRRVPLGGKDRKPPPSWLAPLMVRIHPAMRTRIKAAEAAVRTDLAGESIERWYEEWMPHLVERGEQLRDVDLSNLTDAELKDHVERVLQLEEEGLRIHFKVIFSHMLDLYALIAASSELLGWHPAKSLELLGGLSRSSTEPSRRLAELAKMAATRPRVRELLEQPESLTGSRLADADAEFAAKFNDYRRKYGVAALTRDIKDATVGERPELIAGLISNQIRTGFDPSLADQATRQIRSSALEQARRLLSNTDPTDQQRFEAALVRAEKAYPIREDNVFYTWVTPLGLLRSTALEAARRMVDRGQINEESDVFLLEYDELVVALGNGTDQHALVKRRKGELRWVLDHPAPASYGSAPAPPESLDFLPPEPRQTMSAFMTILDLNVQQAETDAGTAGRIAGVAASPGRYTGPVRVIKGEHEFDRLRPGDVLVCPTTSPTWSILFPSVGALITDSGGILNHPAIIAREYEIPAVVATGDATTRLQEGQVVTVDGSSGLIELTVAETLR